MRKSTTGAFVEQLYRSPRVPLTDSERDEIVDFADSFPEECSYSREQLRQLPDDQLVSAAYWAMADYAAGQL